MTEGLQYRSVPGTHVGLIDDLDEHAVKITYPALVTDAHQSQFHPLAFADSLRREPHPPFLFAHRMDDPIGVTERHQIIPDGPRPRLEIVNRFDSFDANPSAKRAHHGIASGSCSSASFGFSSGEHVGHRSLRNVIVYTRARLRETSCVPVGSIPGARATHLRSAFDYGYGAIDPDTLDALDAFARLDLNADKAAHLAGLNRLRRGERYDADDANDDLTADAVVALARLNGRFLTQGARR